MDYEELYAIIPKSHWLWTIQDTLMWLDHIGLHALKSKFQQCSIDGSILSSLTEEDFICQLQISSKIILKKLMNWISNGLPAFEKYVNSQKMEIDIAIQQTHKINFPVRNRSNNKQQTLKQEKIKQCLNSDEPKNVETNQLIIRNVQQTQTSNFYLKEKGGTIGRQANNEIVIIDQFVSRIHAEIIYQGEKYYIRDVGSSSGTFLKITGKMQLKQGMIIEMGSNQFELLIDLSGKCSLQVIDGPNQGYVKQLKDHDSFSFGRKQSNYFAFPDDQHLSGIHSKIFKMKNSWFIEDIATTNGTWIRLSRQAEQSEAFLLEDKCQFKLSSNLIYECKLNSNNRKTSKNGEKCLICRIEEKNAIIMPCKHAVGCSECLSKLKECPICQTQICDIIKIFT